LQKTLTVIWAATKGGLNKFNRASGRFTKYLHSEKDQKRLFERIFRVGEIQQRFPGMGIGLYICDQIIKNHGGTLWLESEKGKGSTFSFTLPINIAQNNE
jgi:light-regulated signal transduction histidine kinase (bacteriophytochrome)